MKSDEGNSTADASSDKGKSESEEEKAAPTTKDEEEKKEPNDGVKILQEVFGSANDTKQADGPKVEKKEAPVLGPAIPKDDDFDEEEIKKAEEFKVNGNEFFKCR